MALTTDQLKKYWDTANILRKNLDAAEYKHIVLGLVFLKYVSDSFAERLFYSTQSLGEYLRLCAQDREMESPKSGRPRSWRRIF
jgi:type I restriction enzyme M protein